MTGGLWRPSDKRRRRPDGKAAPSKNRSMGSNGDRVLSATLTLAQGAMKITRWTPHQSGSMLGVVDIETASGIRLPDWRVVRSQNGAVWISLPARPLIRADGQLVVNPDGKRVYQPTLGFRDRVIERRSIAQVLEALRRDYPEIFADAGAL